MLATIRSRCAAYDLSPLPPAQCAAWLKNQRPACREAEFLAAVYEGSPGRCLAAVDDPEVTAGLNAARQLAGLIREKELNRTAISHEAGQIGVITGRELR